MSLTKGLRGDPPQPRWGEQRIAGIVSGAVLLVGIVFFLFPVYWLLIGVFKNQGQFFTYPPVFWPTEWGLDNIRGGFASGGGKGLYNSLVIALASSAVATLLGSMAAYSIVRFRVGGRHLAFWILSIRMFPPIAAAIPLFLTMRVLGLLDTQLALMIIYTMMNLPLAVWLMIGFFTDLPAELEEAALVDGCSQFGAFARIAFPLVAPGLVATAVLSFIFSWNEFIFALIMTRSRVQTLPVIIPSLVGGHEVLWGQIAAVSTIAGIPVLILAYLLQRYLVRGLTLGAVKG